MILLFGGRGRRYADRRVGDDTLEAPGPATTWSMAGSQDDVISGGDGDDTILGESGADMTSRAEPATT